MDMESPLIAADDGNLIKFFRKSRHNLAMSQAEGRVVHDDVLMVEVIGPGQKFQQPTFQLKQTDLKGKVRLHPAYHQMREKMGAPGQSGTPYGEYLERWEKDEMQGLAGTPLETLPFLTPAQCAELKAVKIVSAETLAAIPDQNLSILGINGRTLRDKAKAYIDAAKGAAPMTALMAEMDKMREEIAALRANKNPADAPEMEEPMKRGPGRPPRVPLSQAV